jgi:hypothetical protein
MATIHRRLTTRPHTGTSAPCDPTISRAIDNVIIQLDDPSTGRLQWAVLKLRKRLLERHVPAYGASEVQR